ncbi:GGDEF domain-containing protein [Arthrobacter antioxidans]|uniref:GGDEF domain-containing protein n=1 Tax=Arthrobacter antioxidans TaxID=2895818 RepID=UPI001FFF36A7|nr:GGDEF domain-containing protein [Arthrobacter antioxidans]
MKLDVITLQVAFGLIAVTLLVLFYGVSVRQQQSTYSKWWCAAIACFLTGTALYLLDGTRHQVWANPAGNALLVAGAACVWGGARVLRALPPKRWLILAPPIITILASALDSPSTNTWSAGGFLLGFMTFFIALASFETWRLKPDITTTQRPLGVASALLGLYYFGRWIAFLTAGPDSYTFTTYFGTVPTTMFTMVLLLIVSFTMATLSTEQALRDLKAQASHDDLTQILNRRGFLDLATAEIRRLHSKDTPCTVILADMDYFKQINDTYGHPAGDAVLQAVATACTRAIRSTDLVGRYGGEEFILLLPGATPDTGDLVSGLISRTLRSMQPAFDFPLPTISYGIAPLAPGPDRLEAAIAAADTALYDAKSAGRDRAVQAHFAHHERPEPPRIAPAIPGTQGQVHDRAAHEHPSPGQP